MWSVVSTISGVAARGVTNAERRNVVPKSESCKARRLFCLYRRRMKAMRNPKAARPAIVPATAPMMGPADKPEEDEAPVGVALTVVAAPVGKRSVSEAVSDKIVSGLAFTMGLATVTGRTDDVERAVEEEEGLLLEVVVDAFEVDVGATSEVVEAEVVDLTTSGGEDEVGNMTGSEEVEGVESLEEGIDKGGIDEGEGAGGVAVGVGEVGVFGVSGVVELAGDGKSGRIGVPPPVPPPKPLPLPLLPLPLPLPLPPCRAKSIWRAKLR